MSSHLEYLVLLGLCLVITLPLEFGFGARVWRRPRLLLLAVAAVLVVFGVVDTIGIARDWWTYNPQYVTGVQLGDLPLEEIAFFIAIPICGVLTFEAVGICLAALRRRRG